MTRQNVSTALPDQNRWALVGLDTPGRHLLERWSLRADFPLVAICDPRADRVTPACRRQLATAATVSDLLQTQAIDGVIVCVSSRARSNTIEEALRRGLRVLVEGNVASTAAEARCIVDLAAAAKLGIGVFQLLRGDRDFPAARSAAVSGRLGTLRSVRYTSCEYGLSGDAALIADHSTWREPLVRSGPVVFDQLLSLTDQPPVQVQAWVDAATAGFQARIVFSAELAAWIDVQRASLNGLRTGWVLEGTVGAYRAGRLFSLAADGELLEEDVSAGADVEDDVIAELRRLSADPVAAQRSLERSVQIISLQEAIVRSVETGEPVFLSP